MAGLVLWWSGGKDSALALHALRNEHGREPIALLTTEFCDVRLADRPAA